MAECRCRLYIPGLINLHTNFRLNILKLRAVCWIRQRLNMRANDFAVLPINTCGEQIHSQVKGFLLSLKR